MNSGHKSKVTRVRDIVSVEVAKNDVTIKLSNGDGAYVVRGSIRKCMERLPGDLFFMACRGCLVNLLQVAKVDAAARNILLQLKDGREIAMSRKQSIRFRRELAL